MLNRLAERQRQQAKDAPPAAVPNGHGPSAVQPPATMGQHARLGREQLAAGDLRASEQAFRAGVNDPPDAAACLYGLGLIELRRGRLDLAEQYFQRCTATDRAYADGYYQLGALAERRGVTQGAHQMYLTVLSLNRSHASAQARMRVIAPGDAAAAVPQAGGTHQAVPDMLDDPANIGIYTFLRQDPLPISREAVQLMDRLEMTVRPAYPAFVGNFLRSWRFLLVLSLTVCTFGLFAVLALTVGYIRVRCTRYVLSRGRLQIERGVFEKRLVNIDLWRVHGMDLRRTLINRMTGDGTILLLMDFEPLARQIHPRKHRRMVVKVSGLARKDKLAPFYQDLLNLTFLLRGNPTVKGIIQ